MTTDAPRHAPATTATTEESAPRVFISYAQDEGKHDDWVRALADKLRGQGVAAVIDRYEPFPPQGWRRWMAQQIEQANTVLLVCTESYLKRFDGNVEDSPVGKGVRWESQHITHELYNSRFKNTVRFVPVLPSGYGRKCIPVPVADYTSYAPDEPAGYEALYRLLTGQPATPPPPLGPRRQLPPEQIPDFDTRAPGTVVSAQPTQLTPVTKLANPYPGLQAFGPEDSRNFFGRQQDTANVVAALKANGLVSLCAGSGTGKSSLVGAGVEPALREQLPKLCYLRFAVGDNPTEALAEAIDAVAEEERIKAKGKRRKRIEQDLLADAPTAMSHWLPQLGPDLLVLADQFEELFTQTADEDRQAFRAVFEALRLHPGVMLVLTLRDEFMHRLMAWLGGETFRASMRPLERITQTARLRQLIVEPARGLHVPVQDDLVDALVHDMASREGALPLLALTLNLLFEKRDPQFGLTLAAYQAMGRLKGAVETATADFEKVLARDKIESSACNRLFAALTTVNQGVRVRRTAAVATLRSDEAIATLVEYLRSGGLLSDPDGEHVQWAHESLLLHWPRLADWCKRQSGQLAQKAMAEQAARDWAQFGQPAALRWVWERQKPAIEALLDLAQARPQPDPAYTDAGLHAWFGLQASLDEPLRSFLYPEPLSLLEELQNIDCTHARREDIGRRLNQMAKGEKGDPRRGVGVDRQGLPDIDWVDVPGGEVTLETGPPQTLTVAPFRIARYPVTWAQYDAFVNDVAQGYRDPRWWAGLARPDHQQDPGDRLWDAGSNPVINVSWFDAMAFCRWLSHRTGLPISLPTEAQWQWAAAGPQAHTYPWGSDWDDRRCLHRGSGVGRTTAVGLYPGGASASGVHDLAGLVWEWCSDAYDPHEDPTQAAADAPARRAVRGGSWNNPTVHCRAAYRNRNAPAVRDSLLGFRVCW